MRPLTHAVPGALVHLLRGVPLSDGMVAFAWSAAVGPALGRVTAVKLEHGVLIAETTSTQWAREIRRSSGLILARLQTLLGDDAIHRIEVREHPDLKPPPHPQSEI